MHPHITFSFQGFYTSIINNNNKIIQDFFWKNSVALVPYVIYIYARVYPKMTSFTSYSAAPSQTYMLWCAENLKTHFKGN